MALKPQTLLSKTYKNQCISKLNDLPLFENHRKFKRYAAVLVPLCVVDDEVCLLYTLRSSTLSSHQGQVSFPGGKMDEGETVYDTALRETEEEIGFPSRDIDIWTKMCTIRGRDSQMAVSAVVGVLNNFDINKLQPNEDEVAEVFTVPVVEFCDNNKHGSFFVDNLNLPVFNCSKHRVWGMTGFFTHLFLQCFLPEDNYKVDLFKKIYSLNELTNSKL